MSDRSDFDRRRDHGPDDRYYDRRRRGRGGLVAVIVVLSLIIVGGGVYVSGVWKQLVPTTTVASAPATGEIILDPAGTVGTNPFSGESFAPAPDPSIAPAGTESVTATAPAGLQVTATRGETPGLYGGTQNLASCDSDQLVEFLKAHTDKAAAWVSALREDSEVALPDGSPLTIATIGDYVASLTSVTLLSDTRVTNHGFANGVATTFQSVLQGGTAVLVDANGVPRVRCFCGNPLRAAVPVTTTPVYSGLAWRGFSPSGISVVQRSNQPITVFVLRDPSTGKLFDRPMGSKGKKDTAHNSSSTSPTPTTSTAPSNPSTPTTVPSNPSTSTTPPPSTLSIEGAYRVTYRRISSNTVPKTESPDPAIVTITCPSSTSCQVDVVVPSGTSPNSSRVYSRSGNTLTNTIRQNNFVCGNNKSVGGTVQRTITLTSNGGIDYLIKGSGDTTGGCKATRNVFEGTGIRK